MIEPINERDNRCMLRDQCKQHDRSAFACSTEALYCGIYKRIVWINGKKQI